MQYPGRIRLLLTAALASLVLASAGSARAMCADADVDGAVTESDAIRMLRAAAALSVECGPDVCDVDGDGTLTDTDAVLAFRAAAGLPADLSCEPVLADLADPFSGGTTTVENTSGDAFGFPAANLTSDERRDFATGNALFNRNWVTAPSSTTGLDGLGPTFNARSCSACHLHDGRGAPPGEEEIDDAVSLLVRLSVPGTDATRGAVPEPSYGLQLNPFGILGVPGEGGVALTYAEQAGQFDDGASFSLRAPTLELIDLAFGPVSADTLTSPRVGPMVFGLGLLEAVPEADILALADPDDADGDGISGRANPVWDGAAGVETLGRFGWKANAATLEGQTAGAFLGDIGLTTPLFTENDCPEPQTACQEAPTGGEPEVDARKLELVTFYVSTLAVPARRDVDDLVVRHGEELFHRAGCASCHTPTLVTGSDALPPLADQVIHPWTDLLLHDMGEGLADGRPDFAANGREWRTPPLWGIGLIPVVNGHSFLLHDGRARNLEEAILWHGGEAAASQRAFRRMTAPARQALLTFLESL